MTKPDIHLASSSPRRREILDVMGVTFTHAGVDIDESRKDGEAVTDMALRLAREKALAVDDALASGLPILAADTIVVLGDRVFGKPASESDALAMLEALSGRTHRVITAIALRTPDRLLASLSDTEVRFRDISPEEALAYWQSGEPADKAGAYAIQGIGGIFVESVNGSYSGVVGLPVFETSRLLEEAGIRLLTQANKQ
jgi:septum formation protein